MVVPHKLTLKLYQLEVVVIHPRDDRAALSLTRAVGVGSLIASSERSSWWLLENWFPVIVTDTEERVNPGAARELPLLTESSGPLPPA